MAGPEFFATRMGHIFYEGTMPRIAKALERIADALEEQNKPVTQEVHEAGLSKAYKRVIIKSEASIKRALDVIDKLRPCIVWVDEMEGAGIPITALMEEWSLEERESILNTPVEELELSVRSRNCLRTARIETVRDLIQLTPRQFIKTRNAGRRSLNEISVLLRGMGLALKED